MKRKPTSVVLFLICLFVASHVHARVIHVPADESTIRSGIQVAADGDTVMVSPGSYYERDLDFEGRKISVTSTDPGNPGIVLSTIIHANSLGRLFYFHSGEDTTSILSGFTMTDGHTLDWGGAIWCQNASPKIAFNVITNCASDYGGGGIFLEESNAVVRDNVIMGNTAEWGGGGIRCSNSDPVISRNLIAGNSSDYGGGIDCHYDSDPIISRNTILANSAGNGGGVYCYDFSSPVLMYNVVAGNSAEYGGGMHCRYNASPLLADNTFAGNTASIQGGGARCRYSSPLNVINSIFWGNQAPVGKEFYMGDLPSANPSRLTISYTDVEGGLSSIFHEEGNDVVWGEGMIDAFPLFVSQEKDDYRLLWNSPCIDTGNPDSLDLDGTRREIGAYFYDQNQYLTLYLTPDTTHVSRGGRLGLTYTVINRWEDPISFDLESEVVLPNGMPHSLLSLEGIGLPENYTAQVPVSHNVPMIAPLGAYTYQSRTLLPAIAVSGEDRFTFEIGE